MKEQAKQRHVTPYWIAMIYVGVGEKDEAFTWLEKAFEERSFWLQWFNTDPMLDSFAPIRDTETCGGASASRRNWTMRGTLWLLSLLLR